MMYESIARKMFFYDFVFYEVQDQTMYVYCPNCGQTHEITIEKHRKVNDIKKLLRPCACFDYTEQPHFYRSCDRLKELCRTKTVGVFRNDNGEAVLDVYDYTASFDARLYDCGGIDDFGYALRRYPVFADKHVIEMRFKADGKVTYRTRFYIPMCSHHIHVGGWREAKSWHATFVFDIVEESLENLKGTTLEQWTQYVPRMVKTIEKTRNIEYYQMEDWIAGFFMRLHTNQAFRKLFNAGFDRICFENVRERTVGNSANKYYYTSIYQTSMYVNWSAKKLEKMLKTQLSKIDKIYRRKTLTLEQLQGIQDFAKYEKQNVELTKDNLKIANAHGFKEISAIFNQLNIPISKAFKYLRGVVKSSRSTALISDYCDYLDDLIYLGIKLTLDVLFPRNLPAAHERYAILRRQKQEDCNAKKFSQAVAPYKVFDYRDSDYEVKVIRSQKALIAEATKMHNCSAGYVDKILRGASVLFTVKQVAQPRESYCMLEFNPCNLSIVQNRGIRNTTPEQKEQNFVQKWLENIVLPNYRQRVAGSVG